MRQLLIQTRPTRVAVLYAVLMFIHWSYEFMRNGRCTLLRRAPPLTCRYIASPPGGSFPFTCMMHAWLEGDSYITSASHILSPVLQFWLQRISVRGPVALPVLKGLSVRSTHVV